MEIVQSVERALSILEVLSDYIEGLGVTELSEKVGLHKSTVYRLLSTLIHAGYVVQDMETNKYKITVKLFELGSKKIEGMDLLTASKPYTKRLMEKLNEVVHLVIMDETDIIYIDKVEADNPIRMASTIGKRSPLYCTATGRAMLAYLPEEEVIEIWEKSEIEKKTENTITDFNLFLNHLDQIRKQGYAVDNEEHELGVRCVGAPVFNRFGKVEGAISISGPSNRVTQDMVEDIAKEVIKCAELISKEIGFRGK